MMVDVVYKMGIGSEWNDNELRYSLRSLQNFLPLRNVYLIGHKPNWCQHVIHIELPDDYKKNKDANLVNKLILATVDPDLSNEFVNMSDDQIFLEPITLEEFKQPYFNNKHYEMSENGRNNRWQVRLDRTKNTLIENGFKTDCFECHIPTLHSKKDYARTVLRYCFGEDLGYCGNTLYFNTLGIEGRQLEENTLARFVKEELTAGQYEERCRGKKFLNYTESSTTNELFRFLQDKFPTPSKYEIQ